MQCMSLWLGLGGVVIVLAAACSGGDSGDGDRSEGNLRRTAEQFVGDLLNGNVAPLEVTQYFARECREDAAGAVLAARAVVGDADAELEITNVEFESADRALVTSVLLLNGDAFGGPEEGLWVFEDGSWRNADDCEAFGT
jgi:hypothetical protein